MTKIRTPKTRSIEDLDRRRAKFAPVYALLHQRYGMLLWHREQDGMDELVSCILSQNTNDVNRDRAFFALKQQYPTWEEVVNAPTDELINVLRPAGLANQKGPRIQKVLETIHAQRGDYSIDFLQDMPLEEAKAWLTSLDGVGPKTAAIVLCFAYGRPAFPVDTHVHRVGMRIGLLPPKITADHAHPVMESIVPPEHHYDFHIYLIQHGRETCQARKPFCERCALVAHCDYFQASSQEAKDDTVNNDE